MSEWKEYRLGEVAEIIPGFAFKSKDFGENGDLIVKIKDIKPPYVDLSETQRVDLSKYPRRNFDKYKLGKGDYIIAMTGATIGKVGRLKSDNVAYINQRVAKIHPKTGFDADFIYYSLFKTEFYSFIQNNIDSNSAQENISGSSIGRYNIILPPLPEQKSIASVLSSLDDKIDLLHRQNETLEKMAETLFRQWFIEEAKDEWEETRLKSVVDIFIGRTPPRKETKWFSNNSNDLKWVSIKDMGESGVYVMDTSEYLIREAVDSFNIPNIPENTVILSFKMTVGRVAITTEDMISNEAIAQFRFNKNTPFTTEYLYFFLKSFKYDSLGSTSSIVTSINSAMIKDIVIPIPSAILMKDFSNYASPLFRKIKQNQNQIASLEKLRDTLLPKLMSGEVRVKYSYEADTNPAVDFPEKSSSFSGNSD